MNRTKIIIEWGRIYLSGGRSESHGCVSVSIDENNSFLLRDPEDVILLRAALDDFIKREELEEN